MKAHTPTLAPRTVRKSITQTRRDIADWTLARHAAERASQPRFHLIQDLFDSVCDDALLSSQINNRLLQTVSAPFELADASGKPDEQLTEALRATGITADIIRAIVESRFYGYNVIEFETAGDGTMRLFVLPRRNIDPVNGIFYPDAYANKGIAYRDTREYRRWVIDFTSDGLGLINKAVPHVLFKRFAQSCWSELCEIYGIPPRYVKTNTQDPAMLDRAETMLRDMGAAAAFVIDTNEEFQFAQAVSTSGEVYQNLIHLCNNEVSLLVSGAVMGQDTQHGNYSKEQASIAILDRLVEADKRLVETCFNSTVLPALEAIGAIPDTGDRRFRFAAVEDTDRLWQLTKDILPYKDVDNEWMHEKFGIPVSDKAAPDPAALSADRFFL